MSGSGPRKKSRTPVLSGDCNEIKTHSVPAKFEQYVQNIFTKNLLTAR